jgi:hypothetical protein
MIHKTHSPLAGYTRVIFELPASLWADRIWVVGDFNDGQPHQTPLHQERDGGWRAVLDLPVGHQYHFRYLVDGAWHTDFQADGFAVGAEGLPLSLIDTTALAAVDCAERPLKVPASSGGIARPWLRQEESPLRPLVPHLG